MEAVGNDPLAGIRNPPVKSRRDGYHSGGPGSTAPRRAGAQGGAEPDARPGRDSDGDRSRLDRARLLAGRLAGDAVDDGTQPRTDVRVVEQIGLAQPHRTDGVCRCK